MKKTGLLAAGLLSLTLILSACSNDEPVEDEYSMTDEIDNARDAAKDLKFTEIETKEKIGQVTAENLAAELQAAGYTLEDYQAWKAAR